MTVSLPQTLLVNRKSERRACTRGSLSLSGFSPSLHYRSASRCGGARLQFVCTGLRTRISKGFSTPFYRWTSTREQGGRGRA